MSTMRRHRKSCMIVLRNGVLSMMAMALSRAEAFAGNGDASWMIEAKYGIFVHYQHRILLGYSIATKPPFPTPAQMTADGWNRFVDGFDVRRWRWHGRRGSAGAC